MSQTDHELSSEEQLAQDEKLVPISESIRYRKRAQSAEKESQILAKELKDSKAFADDLADKLANVQTDKQLLSELSGLGVVDIEAAMLLARERLRGRVEPDVTTVVTELKNEKAYLFASTKNEPLTVSAKTAGARDKNLGPASVLERAAKRAATTGNRADLQEYLKLRRNFV